MITWNHMYIITWWFETLDSCYQTTTCMQMYGCVYNTDRERWQNIYMFLFIILIIILIIDPVWGGRTGKRYVEYFLSFFFLLVLPPSLEEKLVEWVKWVNKCISRGKGDRCLTRHPLRQRLIAYNTIALAPFPFFFFFLWRILAFKRSFSFVSLPSGPQTKLGFRGSLLSSYLYYLHRLVS